MITMTSPYRNWLTSKHHRSTDEAYRDRSPTFQPIRLLEPEVAGIVLRKVRTSVTDPKVPGRAIPIAQPLRGRIESPI